MDYLTSGYKFLITSTQDASSEVIRYLILTMVSYIICLNLKPKQISIAAGAVCGLLIGGPINGLIIAAGVYFLQKERVGNKPKLPPTE